MINSRILATIPNWIPIINYQTVILESMKRIVPITVPKILSKVYPKVSKT